MKKNIWSRLNIGLILLIFLGMVFLLVKVKKQKDQYIVVGILGSGISESTLQTSSSSSWLVDSIKKGSKEVSISGKNLAEVLEKRSYEEGANKVTILKVKLFVTKNNDKYRYKQKPLEIGSTIDTVLDNVRFSGKVISVGEQNGSKEIYKKVKVVMYLQRPWFADVIKLGDKVLEDNSDNVQSEVLSKKVNLAEVTVPITGRKGTVDTDPRLRDIELELRLRVDSREGLDYFANYQPIKIGNHLWIPMKNYNLYDVEVMDVQDDSRN